MDEKKFLTSNQFSKNMIFSKHFLSLCSFYFWHRLWKMNKLQTTKTTKLPKNNSSERERLSFSDE